MSLTDQDRAWMNRRDELTQDERNTVEEAIEGIREALRANNVRGALNDKFASLEAALIRYLIESRP